MGVAESPKGAAGACSLSGGYALAFSGVSLRAVLHVPTSVGVNLTDPLLSQHMLALKPSGGGLVKHEDG